MNERDDELAPPSTFHSRPIDQFAARVRDTERALNRGDALRPYLTHAANVEIFNEEVRASGRAMRAAYGEHRLDYQLARHAVWMADTARQLGARHPCVYTLGPSLLLLVREILRRFGDGAAASALDELAAGGTREAVRRKFLAPKRGGIGGVLAALRGGHLRAASKILGQCDAGERRELKVLGARLHELLDTDALVRVVVIDVTGESIEEAVRLASEPHRLSESYSE